MIDSVQEHLKRASEKTGFHRESYMEKNMPTLSQNLKVVPFFGDMRAMYIMSSFILKPYKELHKEKYLIMCSWPGFHDMFPYVDEYWCIEEESTLTSLATEANNFYNTSAMALELVRRLNENFSDVVSYRYLKGYYDNGFGQDYWQDFEELKRYWPEIPAANRMHEVFHRAMDSKSGDKVVIFPVRKMRSWQKKGCEYHPVSKLFWDTLTDRLLEEGVTPVFYQNWFTYDMSKKYVNQCVYLVPRDASDLLCAMRYVGCVLDVHSGISRLAIAARTPFVCVDERRRFMEHKDNEIDDLCCDEILKQYIFSFSGLMRSGGPDEWNVSIIDGIVSKLKEFLPKLKDRESWASTQESDEIVSYDKVRDRTAKRMGVRFIRASKEGDT